MELEVWQTILITKRFYVVLLLGAVSFIKFKRQIIETLKKGITSKDFICGIILYFFCIALIGPHTSSNNLYQPTLDLRPESYFSYGHLLGLYVTAAFAFSRLFISLPSATLLALVLALSPTQWLILYSSPIRDYARAPYLLWAIFGMGKIFLAQKPHKVGWAIFIATLLALGTHRRAECLLWLFPALFLLILSLLREGKEGLSPLLHSVVWGGMVFLLLAHRPYFILDAAQASAGYAVPMDSQLRLDRPSYDVGYLFLDEYFYAIADWMGNKRFVSQYLQTLPADFLIRALAVFFRIVQFPFETQLPLFQDSSPFLQSVIAIRAHLQNLGSLIIPFCTFLFTAALFYISFYHGIAVASLLVFGSFLSATQFFTRHYFYWEFLSWLIIFYSIRLIITFLLRRRDTPNKINHFSKQKLLICLTGLALTLLLPRISYEFAKKIQDNNLNTILDHFRSLPRETVGTGAIPLNNKRLPTYYRATFHQCGQIFPILRYQSVPETYGKRWDWSRTVEVYSPAEYFFPAWPGFQGIELPPSEMPCLKTLEKLTRAAPPLPFSIHSPLITFRQQLSHPTASRALPSFVFPVQIEKQAQGLQQEEQGWRFSGHAQLPIDAYHAFRKDRSRSFLASRWKEEVNPSFIDTDILITEPFAAKKGMCLQVSGELKTGGLDIGLVEGRFSAGFHSIYTPGKFSVDWRIAHDGTYRFGAAHFLSAYSGLENRFLISSIHTCETQ